MKQNKSLIDRIPFMDAKSRANLRENIENVLKKKPKDEQAVQTLSALNAIEESDDRPRSLESTGLLEWEKNFRNEFFTFRAFHEGRVVGKILKRANHSEKEKDVHTVEILGKEVAGEFNQIKDARAAGEVAFVEWNLRTKSHDAVSTDP
jgi:hypothetical protein